MTTVTAGLQYVRNLGNFENVRLNVEISDSKKENETTSQAFDRVYSLVEKKLVEKMQEIERELKD